MIRAQFRTKLIKPENLPDKPGVKYQTRIDSIQFSLADDGYRVAESKFLDASGRVLLSESSTNATDWKPILGRTGNLLLHAASQLQPFGTWRVVSYRYASGEAASDNDPEELKTLIGTDVYFKPNRMVAGKETCYAPVLDGRTVTNEEYIRRIGSPLKSVGLSSDKLDAIFVTCGTKTNPLFKTILIRLPDHRIIMLWEGVFLELERIRTVFEP